MSTDDLTAWLDAQIRDADRERDLYHQSSTPGFCEAVGKGAAFRQVREPLGVEAEAGDECPACDGTGTTYAPGHYVPGEQFVEPPTGPDMCGACRGTGRLASSPPAPEGEAPEGERVEEIARQVAPLLFSARPDSEVGPGVRGARDEVRSTVARVLMLVGAAPTSPPAPGEGQGATEGGDADRENVLLEYIYGRRFSVWPQEGWTAGQRDVAQVLLARIDAAAPAGTEAEADVRARAAHVVGTWIDHAEQHPVQDVGAEIVGALAARGLLAVSAPAPEGRGAMSRMLAEFHAALGQTFGDGGDSRTLRGRLHDEEHRELRDEIDAGNRVGIARELADVVYLAFGTAFSEGIDLDAVLREVHRANMDKRGSSGRFTLRADGKVMKPVDWTPPDIAAVLATSPPAPGEGQGERQGGSAGGVGSDMDRAADLVSDLDQRAKRGVVHERGDAQPVGAGISACAPVPDGGVDPRTAHGSTVSPAPAGWQAEGAGAWRDVWERPDGSLVIRDVGRAYFDDVEWLAENDPPPEGAVRLAQHPNATPAPAGPQAEGGGETANEELITGADAAQLPFWSIVQWEHDRSDGGLRRHLSTGWEPPIAPRSRYRVVLHGGRPFPPSGAKDDAAGGGEG